MKSPRIPLVICAAAVLMLAVLPLGAAEHSYTGTRKCKACHLKEWKSWSMTKMANAFDVLKPGERAKQKTSVGLDPSKDYTKDKECLGCHTTGYGKAGGFVDMEKTPELAGVGCEMCHGPGGDYTGDGYMTLKNKYFKRADIVKVGFTGEVTEKQCEVCHNTKSPFVGDDYVFDFAKKKDQGTHEKFPLKYKH